MLWVGAGLISLRRLRGLGAVVDDEEITELQQQLRTAAEVRYVQGLQQPATFGFRHPVVLLPEDLRSDDGPIRRALIAHELFHVQRRDWAWVLGEELVLALFWFNPALWWVVSRVRLTREEAVDELAILATGSRRTYVRALLAYAEDAPLAPAPAFAHRRHLFHRITLISKEAVMSSSRIVVSCAVMALVVISGSRYAASAFPLIADVTVLGDQAPGPVEQRAAQANAQNPVPKRTDYTAPEYPVEARAVGGFGSVMLRLTLDEAGRVVEARRTGFSVTDPQSGASVRIDDATPESVEAFASKATFKSKDGRVIDSKVLVRLADAMTVAAQNAVRNWRYEPPTNGPLTFEAQFTFNADGETTVSQIARGERRAATRSGEPLGAAGAVRVGNNIKTPAKITDVRPIYPPIAQQARVSGMVIAEILVDRDGFVEHARVLRSIPLLDQAALDAVYQWRFTPTLLNGVPTPVIMTVTVNFTLQ